MSAQPQPTRQVIVPLDPDSPRGRQVAAEWSDLFIEIRAAIARRKAEQAEAGGGQRLSRSLPSSRTPG
jgi:hypothetical protein